MLHGRSEDRRTRLAPLGFGLSPAELSTAGREAGPGRDTSILPHTTSLWRDRFNDRLSKASRCECICVCVHVHVGASVKLMRVCILTLYSRDFEVVGATSHRRCGFVCVMVCMRSCAGLRMLHASGGHLKKCFLFLWINVQLGRTGQGGAICKCHRHCLLILHIIKANIPNLDQSNQEQAITETHTAPGEPHRTKTQSERRILTHTHRRT